MLEANSHHIGTTDWRVKFSKEAKALDDVTRHLFTLSDMGVLKFGIPHGDRDQNEEINDGWQPGKLQASFLIGNEKNFFPQLLIQCVIHPPVVDSSDNTYFAIYVKPEGGRHHTICFIGGAENMIPLLQRGSGLPELPISLPDPREKGMQWEIRNGPDYWDLSLLAWSLSALIKERIAEIESWEIELEW